MRRIIIRFVLYAVTSTGLVGCAALGGLCLFDCGSSRAGSTPLVAYLYPDGHVPNTDTVPVLKVPLTVGLSFLPDRPNESGIDAREKERILAQLRDRFRSLDYVRDIIVIPDSYLQPKGGYDSLAQLARLQNFDVIALVSYDQVSRRNENKRSLAYLTIVGAYMVRGSESETSTLLDLAVVDPQTRSLLLRAGGTSFSSGSSTAIEQAEKLRDQSKRGIELASDRLVTQLYHELAVFSERVRAGNGPVQVVKREPSGSGGPGGLTLPWVLLLAGLPWLSGRCRRDSTKP